MLDVLNFCVAAFAAGTIGSLAAFIEVYTKFRSDFTRVLTDRKPRLEIFRWLFFNWICCSLAFLVIANDPAYTWVLWKKAVAAGAGFPALMRLKVFSFETSKGESYGFGIDAFHKVIQDFFLKRIDDHLLLLRAKILKVFKTLPATVLESAVRTLISARRLPDIDPKELDQRLAALAAAPDEKIGYLSEVLINNGTLEYNLSVLEDNGRIV